MNKKDTKKKLKSLLGQEVRVVARENFAGRGILIRNISTGVWAVADDDRCFTWNPAIQIVFDAADVKGIVWRNANDRISNVWQISLRSQWSCEWTGEQTNE